MSIMRYIADDLRARIRAGAELPAKLTLAGLSEFYQVSMMPVRQAVGELVDADVLRREENGRLTVNPHKRGKTSTFAAPAPPTDWQEVIAAEVVKLSLQGTAVPLKIAEVAERHGIGRTSVHAIFHRLAGEGMLEHAPRCGWSVRPFRADDLDAYLDVRERLELHALDLAWPRLEEAELRDLLRRNRAATSDSPAQLDNSLHRYWVDRCGNRYVLDFFDRHGSYYSALYARVVQGKQRIATLAAQHRTILEHILAGKRADAQAALAVDIRSLRPILAEAIETAADA